MPKSSNQKLKLIYLMKILLDAQYYYVRDY